MKVPQRLLALLEDGMIDEVICQLMSGKEAQVYMVRCGTTTRCAKVFKEARQRSFKQAAVYQEGRRERSSRRNRAMSKKTRYGQKEQENAWLNAEVAALRRLAAAQVRVPQPLAFLDGVLLMELITDAEGYAAPRLGDVEPSPAQAEEYYRLLIDEVVRMLCAGIVHGDLSPFNILLDSQGPVIIDLPQAIDAAGNNSAEALFERDVNTLRAHLGAFAPSLLETEYAKEIWALYRAGALYPDMKLSGQFRAAADTPDLAELMAVIEAAKAEEAEAKGLAPSDAPSDP